MKFVFLALAVVFLVSDVHGFFGGRPGGPGGMMRPPFNHRRGPPLGGGEPWKRKPADNEDKCNFNEKMEARNKVTVEPSDKCLEQVKQFFYWNQRLSQLQKEQQQQQRKHKSLLFLMFNLSYTH
ncbi:hypothetical protein CEXT_642461 [Caerostris extrusa]|uniref:Uncharacterized protein n=1 Tax=Caerostris extrusa TaxID=172846 RepID=A0AAV4PH69_CAEEX|nr:hypothetical protein CEXT_642461 [Caerostris extrusa]